MIQIKKFKIEEMPHFSVGSKFYDLEIEKNIHLSRKDFLEYIIDFVDEDKEVAKELLDLPILKTILIKYYDKDFWNSIEEYLLSL